MLLLTPFLVLCLTWAIQGKLTLGGFPSGKSYYGINSMQGRVIFTCDVTSTHPVKLQFFINGRLFDTKQQNGVPWPFEWPKKHGRSGVTIVQWPYTHPLASGVYECKADNKIDPPVSRKVTYLKKKDRLIQPGSPQRVKQAKISDRKLYVGDNATFRCDATGEGETQLAWFINQVPVDMNSYKHILSDDKKTFTFYDLPLIKEKLQLQCYAANDVGVQRIEEYLISTFKPKPTPTTEPPPGITPFIIVKPQNVSVNAPKQIVTFTCKATGQPSPTYTWTKGNGDVISRDAADGRVQFTAMKSGSITCRASNHEGVDTATAFYNVKPVPFAPFRVSALTEGRTQTSFAIQTFPSPDEVEYHPLLPLQKFIIETRPVASQRAQYLNTANNTVVKILTRAPWQHMVNNMLPWTQLELRVRFANKYGVGAPSKWLACYTKMAELTSMVEVMKSVAHSGTSFTLSWRDADRLNGKITHYEVSWSTEPTKGWQTHQVPDYQHYYKYKWQAAEGQPASPVVYWKVKAVGLDGKGVLSPQHVFRVAKQAPGFVTLVTAKVSGSREVHVYWNATSNVGSGLVGHQILWRKTHSTKGWHSMETKGAVTRGIVEGLQPNQQYQFMVVPRSKTAYGVRSNIIQTTTWTDAPTAPPQNVRVSAERARSIHVYWQPPVIEHHNGNITHYKVFYTRKLGREPLFVVAKSSMRSIYIQGLSQYVQYTVWVVAVNDKGDGPPSKSSTLYTKEKVPEEAVQSVQAQALNDTVIAVTWLPPRERNGLIVGYNVYYRRHRNTVEYGGEVKVVFSDNSVSEAILTSGVDGSTGYRVQVAAFTVLGEGIKSSKVYLDTPPKLQPSPILKLVSDKTLNMVTLKWWPRTTYAESYRIEYGKSLRKYDMLTHKKVKEVTADIRVSTFDDLDPGVWYCFIVSAKLGKYEGYTASTIAWELISDGVPQGPPLFFEGLAESSSTIKLQWEPPDAWLRSGTITGYDIEYRVISEIQWKRQPHKCDDGKCNDDVIVYLLTGLTASTKYEIKVLARSQVGAGPVSSQIQVTTGKEVLPVVSKLVAMEIEEESVYLRWGEPTNTVKFKHLKYIIEYSVKKSFRKANGAIKTLSVTRNTTIFDRQIQLSHLLAGSTYTVSVRVKTEEAGNGEPVNITFTTRNKPPSSVPVPKINATNLDYIPLHIIPASNKQGPISHYLLFVIDLGTSSTLSPSVKSQDFGGAEIKRYRRSTNSSGTDRPDFHIAAILYDDELPMVYRLGDGSHGGNYHNQQLNHKHYYSTFIRAFVQGEDELLHTDSPLTPSVLFESSSPGTSVAEQSNTGKSKGPNIVVYAAGAGGGVLLIVVLLLVVVLLKRRNRYSGEDTKPLNKRRASFRTSKKLSDPTEVHRLHCNTPGMMKHPPIHVEVLSKHVNNLKMDNNTFIHEYESIQSVEKLSSETARSNANISKNRYPNVVAFDETRVKLEYNDSEGLGYINANYIDGYCKEKAYIATQGPLKSTVDDFWMMVWEQNVQTIVMMTKLQERGWSKCEQYWPDSGVESYGTLDVELKSELLLCNDCTRTFQVRCTVTGESRVVKHYQYLQWHDPGVPTCPGPVLAFVRRVHTFEPPGCGPTVVHCSAGVGRSACYIAIDAMLERIKYDNLVDIYGYVTMMRSQRNFMVQTDEQYMFVYDVIVEAIECGNTELTGDEFSEEFRQLTALLDKGRETLLETQFKSITAVTAEFDPSTMTVGRANGEKNRSQQVVPFDANRVQLNSTEYLNASHIDGYYRANQYIATQAPTEKTASDFWRMLMESKCSVVVMLTDLQDKQGTEQCFEYWPTTKTVKHHLNVIDPVKEDKFANFIVRTFKVTDMNTSDIRTVRHYQYLNWPSDRVPDSTESMIEFIGHVQKTTNQNTPVICHSSLGAGRTGVFITLSIALESLRNEDKVDIYQIVKSLRHQRPSMVHTLEQYEYCYKVTFDFLRNFDVIA